MFRKPKNKKIGEKPLGLNLHFPLIFSALFRIPTFRCGMGLIITQEIFRPWRVLLPGRTDREASR